MSPRSDAEDRDESLERELFARRARALGDPAVPALSDVLRRAAASDAARSERPRSGGWAQLAGSVCLAAAVMLGAVRSLPSSSTDDSRARGGAAPDAGLVAASTAVHASWLSEDDTAACSLDPSVVACEDSCSCVDPVPASVEPPAASLACEDEELCSLRR